MKAALLIHGFATTIHDFDSIIPFLKKKYDAIFIDNLPGHGDQFDSMQFTADATLKFVESKFDEAKSKYDEVDVYGFSMGGALATYLASVRSVNRLILLAPANAYLNAAAFVKMIKKDIKYTIKKEKTNRSVLRENEYRSAYMLLYDLLPNYNIQSLIAFMDTVRKCNLALKENNVKTLIVYGEMDELVPKRSREIINKYFKNVSSKEIHDLGHLMLYSRNYRLIINEIKDFLEKTE